MKYLFILSTLLTLSFTQANSQVSFGVKGGSSPAISPNTFYTIANRTSPQDEFTFNVTNVNSGLHFGAFTELNLDQSFFLRGEAIYNSFETDYFVRYTFESRFRSSMENTFTERMQRIDFPVSLGARLGAVDVFSGIVPRVILSNENEMSSIEGYGESLDNFQFGIQSGVGINLLNMQLGITYQMDFQNYGSHIIFNNEALDLQNKPSRLIATLAYKF